MKPNTIEKDSYMMGFLIDMVTYCNLEAKLLKLDNKTSGIESTLRSIVDKSYKILEASNKNIKVLINKLENTTWDKAIVTICEDQGGATNNKHVSDKRTSASVRKMFTTTFIDFIQINYGTKKMD